MRLAQCRQESVMTMPMAMQTQMLMPMQTISTSKTVCPPPWRLGNINSVIMHPHYEGGSVQTRKCDDDAKGNADMDADANADGIHIKNSMSPSPEVGEHKFCDYASPL